MSLSSVVVLTIRAVISNACKELPEFTAGLEVSKAPLRKTLTIGFPADSFVFFTDSGERGLGEMKLTVDVWQTAESATQPKVVRYESAQGVILEVSQTEIEGEPGRKLTILASQTPPADYPD